MKTHREMTNPLFHLIVWSSVLLLFMLRTARKLFLAVLGLRCVRQKWLSNFPLSRRKSSVSQPVIELTNRCCGVRCHNIRRRKRSVSSPVPLLLSVYPAFCHFSQYSSSPSPVYIEPHCCKLHFCYAAARISRHLCPYKLVAADWSCAGYYAHI